MSEIYMMIGITNRSLRKKFLSFYKENQISTVISTLGAGTARSEVLDYFGLEDSEKVVDLAIVTLEVWKHLKKELQQKLQIDIPGMGIAFIVPLSSICGTKTLQFLTEKQNYIKQEETTLKDTKYALLVIIANQGYNNMVMDAARSANAAGGTVIHAKGTGMEEAEKFFDVALSEEKEVILIVTKTEQKNDIMKAIIQKAGMETKARSIVFSLPVTSIAGFRLVEEDTSE